MKLNFSSPQHKFRTGKLRSGSILVETTIAIVLLTSIGLVLFKGTLNIIAPRQWALSQNLTDAYLTYEKAYAERIEFSELISASSDWPVFPAKSEFSVTLGTLPGGRSLSGTMIRTRIADPNNLATAGGSGDSTTNPSELQTWKLQSHLIYTIAGRDYVKSRTVVRTQ
jgi:hypothetical protein